MFRAKEKGTRHISIELTGKTIDDLKSAIYETYPLMEAVQGCSVKEFRQFGMDRILIDMDNGTSFEFEVVQE
jgi:hypothetical protein